MLAPRPIAIAIEFVRVRDRDLVVAVVVVDLIQAKCEIGRPKECHSCACPLHSRRFHDVKCEYLSELKRAADEVTRLAAPFKWPH